MEELYSFDVGDCEQSVCWHAYSVVRITNKYITVGYQEETYRLDRRELEQNGEVYCRKAGKFFCDLNRKTAQVTSKPYMDRPVHRVRYDPPDPRKKLTPAQREQADVLVRDYFCRSDGTDADCQLVLALKYDLPVCRSFIAKIRKEIRGKRQEPQVTDTQYEAFLGLLRAISSVAGKHTAFEDGPRWWRLITEWTQEDGEERRSIYGFVRKEDGALFIADGWHKPRKDGGPVGFVHDHAAALGRHCFLPRSKQSRGRK